VGEGVVDRAQGGVPELGVQVEVVEAGATRVGGVGVGWAGLAGAGVVDEVVLAVGVAPDPDAGEGLAAGPGAEGLDAVVEAAEQAIVAEAGLAGWPVGL